MSLEDNDADFFVSVSDRICSLHFKGGRKVGNISVPTVFNGVDYGLPKRIGLPTTMVVAEGN